MTPDLAQIGMTLMLFGLIAVVAWVRPAIDLTLSALSLRWTAWTSLYAKEPRA